jgi:hypothetical protein
MQTIFTYKLFCILVFCSKSSSSYYKHTGSVFDTTLQLRLSPGSANRNGKMPVSKTKGHTIRFTHYLKQGRHSMTTRPIGSKQNIQLLSVLSETLERSKQNRSETLTAIAALRSHVTALSSSHQSNIMDASPLKQSQQSIADPSACYSELLLSKYRENCNRMQQELYETKARLSASESHVQSLEVQLVRCALFVHFCACIFMI